MLHFRTTSDYQWEIGSMLDRGVAVDVIQWQLEREGLPEERVRWLIKSVNRSRFDRRLARITIAALVIIAISIFANLLVHGTAYQSLERLTGLCITVSALIVVTWLYRAVFRAEEFDWDPRGIIPPHVAAPTPRSVIRKKHRRSRQGRLQSIYLCLIAGLVLLMAWVTIKDSLALKRQGVETQGQIFNYRHGDGNDYADYRFVVRRRAIVQSRYVTRAFRAAHPRGSIITVTYLPEDPRVSQPARRAAIAILPEWLRTPAAAGWFFLGAVLLLLALGRRRSVDTDFILGRDGVVIVADVEGYYAGVAGYHLDYRFEVAGKTYVTQGPLPEPPSFRPQRHDRVVILYDPNDPNRNRPLDALTVEICPPLSSADSRRRAAAASGTD